MQFGDAINQQGAGRLLVDQAAEDDGWQVATIDRQAGIIPWLPRNELERRLSSPECGFVSLALDSLSSPLQSVGILSEVTAPTTTASFSIFI